MTCSRVSWQNVGVLSKTRCKCRSEVICERLAARKAPGDTTSTKTGITLAEQRKTQEKIVDITRSEALG